MRKMVGSGGPAFFGYWLAGAKAGGRVMQLVVLTYHSMNIDGVEYDRNDHVALAADLRYLSRNGFLFLPAHELVDILLGGQVPDGLLGRKVVVLTCDDGSDYDAGEIVHPRFGRHAGFLGLLKRSVKRPWWRFAGRYARAHMTSFVIASPQGRAALDIACMGGRGQWNDGWWSRVVASGHMHIGSHSWDHRHDALPEGMRPKRRPGTFLGVDTADEADRQVRQARQYIQSKAPNPADDLFAYPYGDVPDWLADEWLPNDRGTRAAFTTEPEYVTLESNPYRIPRFVCGQHWRSPAEFRAIVDGSRL